MFNTVSGLYRYKPPISVTLSDNGSGFVRVTWVNTEAGVDIEWFWGVFSLGMLPPDTTTVDDTSVAYPPIDRYFIRYNMHGKFSPKAQSP
jgi:hypothetical protein